jgi:hypothetical protein
MSRVSDIASTIVDETPIFVKVPEVDRRLAPVLALCVGGMVGAGVACMWLAYRFKVWS